jgi:hypothetical protein
MGRFAKHLGDGHRVLWLDYFDYAGPLLTQGGEVPWTDETATVAWYRKAQGLLGSDVVTLPVWRIASTLMAQDTLLREQMRAKPRVTHPLRALFANEAFRQTCTRLAESLRAVFPHAVLALSLPSPRLAVLLAYRASVEPAAEGAVVGEDEVDSAAPYMAEFLRSFGDAGIDALLLHESAATQPSGSDEIEWYRPVLNVGAHYQWDVGLELVGEGALPDDVPVDFVVLSRPTAADESPEPAVVGLTRPGSASRGPVFLHLRIPAHMAPEAALQRLNEIRSSAAH